MSKILIIEDSNLLRIRMIKVLQQYGYTNVIGFSSADLIENKPELFLKDIDLIITDITLPGISGIELTKTLNNNPKFSNIPIIFISSHSDISNINEAIKAGAVDYLVKPFEDHLLIERLKKVIGEPVPTSSKQNGINDEELKTIISMEYERAARGKQFLSFIKLKMDVKNVQNTIIQIKKLIRKIDTVNVYQNLVIVLLPLTDKKGLEIVYDKIQSHLVKEGIEILEKNCLTFKPDSNQSFEELIKEFL